MGRECPKCGMTSDRDDICTWCNADIKPPPKEKGGARGKKAPGSTGPPSGARGEKPAEGGGAPKRRKPAPPPEPAAPERPGWLVPVIIVAAILIAAVGGLFLMGVTASGPPAEAGEEWTQFTSKDKSFTAWYPNGWGEPDNAGSAGTFVRVKWSGSKLCEVLVRGSSGAGTKGDMAAAKERVMAANLEPGQQLPLEQTADGAMLDYFKNDEWLASRKGYEEGQAKFDYTFDQNRSAYAEYSFTKTVGLLPVKMKGMRWAAQKGDYAYHVTAEAPEKHWSSFQGVAGKIVGSVKLGAG